MRILIIGGTRLVGRHLVQAAQARDKLSRAVARGLLSEGRALQAIADYLDLPLTRHGHQGLMPRMFALRANFSVYDAAYVALAERLSADLLTMDAKLGRAVRTHVGIQVLSP